MMYAKKIKMRPGCGNSSNLQEIAEIYVDGCNNPGFFPKETLHNHVKENPNSIKVFIDPYPSLLPATSQRGEKYVRSAPNQYNLDNLLNLPRV